MTVLAFSGERLGAAPAAARGAATLAIALVLAGCVPRLPEMVVQESVCPTCPTDGRFANAIDVGRIAGGRANTMFDELNLEDAVFREALETSLSANRLLSPKRDTGAYVLDSRIIEVTKPYGGFVSRTFVSIRYTVDRRATGERVFDELIQSQATFTTSDELIGPQRNMRAVETAVKNNIRKLIERLLGGPPHSRLEDDDATGKIV